MSKYITNKKLDAKTIFTPLLSFIVYIVLVVNRPSNTTGVLELFFLTIQCNMVFQLYFVTIPALFDYCPKHILLCQRV